MRLSDILHRAHVEAFPKVGKRHRGFTKRREQLGEVNHDSRRTVGSGEVEEIVEVHVNERHGCRAVYLHSCV